MVNNVARRQGLSEINDIYTTHETGVKGADFGKTPTVTRVPLHSVDATDNTPVCMTSESGKSTCVFNACHCFDYTSFVSITNNYFCLDVSMSELKEQLEMGKFWNVFRIVKSMPDGHCLVSSVYKSLILQHKRTIDNGTILEAIEIETQNNAEMYGGFLEESQKANLVKFTEDYIYRKIYNSPFGDHMPLAIANALLIDLIIIEVLENSWHPRTIFASHGITNAQVYIYKCGEHYDGIGFTNCLNDVRLYDNDDVDRHSGEKDPKVTLVREFGNRNFTVSADRATSLKLPKTTATGNTPRENSLTVCFWNIRGLYHYKLCKNICGSFLAEFDLILLCETWSENNNTFELDGCVYLDIYCNYKHRSARRGSGGIGIFVRNSMYRKGIELYRANDDKIAWVKLKKKFLGFNKDILLGMVYFPPENSTCNTVDVFTTLLEEVSSLP